MSPGGKAMPPPALGLSMLEARDIEEEQVERRASLERQARPEERMRAKRIEEFEHVQHLIQHLGGKPLRAASRRRSASVSITAPPPNGAR
jgi:hypothetical protein